jgi:hypothetical protein
MTQYARPDSNVTTTGFTGSYTDIDEVTYSMSDYISGDGLNNQTDYYFEVGLSDVTDPNVGTGHVLGATWNMSSSQSHTIKIQLYQGTTLIATALNWTGTYNSGSPVGGGINDNNVVSYTLTSTEANNITDYSNLRIRFYLKKNTGLGGRTGRFGWGELAVPDASTNITVNSGNPPVVTVGGNTNTTISTSTNISIDSGTTNITVDALDSFVDIGTPIFITVSNTPNVNIAGNAATITTTSSVEIFEGTGGTNTLIAGQPATITADFNAIINAEVTNINVITNHPPSVSSQQFVQIAVNESNIQVGGNTQVLELYTALVKKHNPYHYIKGDKHFESQESLPDNIYYGLMKQHGSASYQLLLSNAEGPENGSTSSGIKGDPSLGRMDVAAVYGDSGSEFLSSNGRVQPEIFPTDANATYEIWINTDDTHVPIFSIDAADTFPAGRYRNTTVIGIYNGYLCQWDLTSSWNPTNLVQTTNYVSDGSFHHLAFTKETNPTTGLITYKSYFDGQETSTVISIGTFTRFPAGAPESSTVCQPAILGVHSSGPNVNGTFNTSSFAYTFTASIDEFATYKKTLTSADLLEHYRSGLGYIGVTVNASVTDIEVDAKDSALGVQINPVKTNIGITALGASIATDDNVLILTTTSNTDLDGKDFTTSNSASVSIAVQKHNTDVLGRNAQISIASLSFKFVSAQDLALGAKDATAIESLQFGGMLYNQIKKLLFRLGNTGDLPCRFNVSVTSNETTLLPAIKLSKDNQTYSNSITIESIRPNGITDIIWVKFDVNEIDVLGPGTFLINVEQLNE